MQSLAVLWFQLQLAEQSLRDKNFAPANAEPTAIGTPRSDHREILVHRLAYNDDVVAFKMGRRQGARRAHI